MQPGARLIYNTYQVARSCVCGGGQEVEKAMYKVRGTREWTEVKAQVTFLLSSVGRTQVWKTNSVRDCRGKTQDL